MTPSESREVSCVAFRNVRYDSLANTWSISIGLDAAKYTRLGYDEIARWAIFRVINTSVPLVDLSARRRRAP